MANSANVVPDLNQKNTFPQEALVPGCLVSQQKNILTFDEKDYIQQSEWSEPFAREIAYNLSQDRPEARQKTLFELNQMGYEVKPLDLNRQLPVSEGIYAYILEPKAGHQNLPLIVLSQGTQAQDLSTLHQDVDPEGPGRQGVESNAPTIVHQLSDSLARSKASKIVFTGHSLGGALSQLLANEVLRVLADKKPTALDQLKSLELSTFQSAGVSAEVYQEAEKNIRAAKANHPGMHFSCVAAYKIGDLVGGNTGEHLLCGEALGPDMVDAAVIKMDLAESKKIGWMNLKNAVLDSGLSLFVNPTIGNIVYQFTWQVGLAFMQDAYNRHVDPCFVEGWGEHQRVLDKSSLKYEVLTNATPEERNKLQAEISSRNLLDRGTFGAYSRAIRNTLYLGTCEKTQKVLAEALPPLAAVATVGSGIRSAGSAVTVFYNMTKDPSLLTKAQDAAKFGLAVRNVMSTTSVLIAESKKRPVSIKA